MILAFVLLVLFFVLSFFCTTHQTQVQVPAESNAHAHTHTDSLRPQITMHTSGTETEKETEELLSR